MALILLGIPSSLALGGHYPCCFRASFLSQCLPHSSHILGLLSWEAPDHVRISVCLCGTETAVEEWGSCPNLYVSTHFLTCGCSYLGVVGGGGIAGMLYRGWGEAKRCQIATSPDFVICYHAEFVVTQQKTGTPISPNGKLLIDHLLKLELGRVHKLLFL